MAIRPVFIVSDMPDKFVEVVNIKFKWYPGYSKEQKQKSINSLHENFKKEHNESNILEVSSKSPYELGVKLSAFNLTIKREKRVISVESAFQASKVFEFGGPYTDLLDKSPRQAKKDPRLKNSGRLKYFKFDGKIWGLEPKTQFYDWLYINALARHQDLVERVIQFNAFTDIEFNPKKSINCQARSAALFVSLYKRNLLEKALLHPESYIEVIKGKNQFKEQQLSFFNNYSD